VASKRRAAENGAVTYRVVFDVAERIPVLGIGVVAAIAFAVAVILAVRSFDDIVRHLWVVASVGAVLVAVEAWLNRDPMLVIFAIVSVFGAVIATRAPVALPDGVGRRRSQLPPQAVGVLFAFFSIFVAMTMGLSMLPVVWLKDAVANGQATIVEGVVDIYSKPSWKAECIDVAGRQFCYSQSVVTVGYNQKGGPIVDGASVRLSLVDDTIIRVELADPAP
jgi:hypothetical protein